MLATLRAELLKLRTTRTTRAFLLVAVGLVGAGVAQHAAIAGRGGVPPLDAPELQEAMLATPSRGRVVVAAALANLLAGATVGLAATLTAVLATVGILAASGTGLAVAGAEIAAAAAGAAAWAALAALVGFGVGAVARNQALAVALVAVLLLALEQVLASGLPDVARWLPGRLGSAVASGRLDGDPGALAAAAALAAWGLALTAAGWAVMRRADAR